MKLKIVFGNMPKRSLVSPSSPSSSSRQVKRSKAQSGQQPTITDFFSSPKSKSRGDNSEKTKGKRKASTPSTSTIHSPDEAYAWRLAKDDGLDLEELQALENQARRTITRKNIEVIDVDELDDELPRVDYVADTSPSTLIDESSSVQMTRSNKPDKGAVLPTLDRANLPDPFADCYRPLSVDPVEYSLENDDWLPGSPIPYSFITHTLVTLSETRSRILILNTLTNSLRTITKHHPPSLLPALYLLSNTLSPPYVSVELGLGPSTISKAIQQISGLSSATLRKLYNSTGDPGTHTHDIA